MNFTENELQVMQILWNAKTDLSRKDIIEQSPNRTWKDNSIHVLLNSLMKKGAVKVVGMQPAGKVYARTFAADISQEEYLSAQMTVSPPQRERTPLSDCLLLWWTRQTFPTTH